MKKKLLSILICMTIAVGMFPTMAYATVDGTEIENQQVNTRAARSNSDSNKLYCIL